MLLVNRREVMKLGVEAMIAGGALRSGSLAGQDSCGGGGNGGTSGELCTLYNEEGSTLLYGDPTTTFSPSLELR